MTDRLGKLIAAVTSKKSGSKDFALFYFEDAGSRPSWRADIGCTSSNLTLGEVAAEFDAWGPTAVAAVAALLAKVPT